MSNPCDFYIKGKKMKMEQFLSYAKSLPHSELNEILGGIPSFKNIPEAPFITDTNNTVKLGLKFALQEAVRQGVDKIAWTTGEQQNARYDLSKQVDEIKYVKNEDGEYLLNIYKNGERIETKSRLTEKGLEDLVGKEVAQKIINGEGDKSKMDYVDYGQPKSLKGDNLKVGGKGMIGFYGSVEQGKEGIVGGVAKALVKELTGKPTEIGEAKIETASVMNFQIAKNTEDIKRFSKSGSYQFMENGEPISKNRAYELIEKGQDVEARFVGKSTQSSIDITPELEAAVERGMPQFSRFKRGSMSSEQARTEMGGMLKEAYRQIKEEKANPQSTYDAIFETDQYRSLTPEQRTILHDSIRYFHPDVTTATKDTQNITHVDIKEQSAVLETLKSDRDLAYIYRNFPKIVKQLRGKGIIETKGDCI